MRRKIVLVALLICSPALAGDMITGRASVIDGDTIEIRGERIRLHGIDAPESSQSCERGGTAWRCGQKAAFELANHLGARNVSCERLGQDRYRRTIARCTVGGEDIGSWMVGEGLALAYRKYSADYVREEASAKAQGAGLWAGQFIAPWEWRRGAR